MRREEPLSARSSLRRLRKAPLERSPYGLAHELLLADIMRRLATAASVLALALLPACAPESEEDAASVDAALEQEWGELDEDATPLTQAERAEALGDDEGDPEIAPEAGVPEEADAEVERISPPPPLPAGCDRSSSLDLLVYSEGYSGPILKALSAHAKPCSRYVVSIPKVAASAGTPDAMLWPRAVRGKGVRAYGSGFVASAEVHWGGARSGDRVFPGWKSVAVVKLGPGRYATRVVKRSEIYDNDWFFKGVLFRQRMAKRGFRPQAGDTWHINELESAWTRTRVQQRAIRDLVRGLAEGDQEYDAFTDADPEIAKLSSAEKQEITAAARMKDVKGTVFVSSLGKRRPGETTSAGIDAALKQTLRRARFWADMNKYVSRFALERYTSFAGTCKSGQTLSAQDDAMAQFIMQLQLVAARAPRYQGGARKGQSTVGTALSYLSRAYHPVINAAWGFRLDDRSLPQMTSFVAGQVHATRAYAASHRTPDNRIGIYFRAKDGAPDAITAQFADRIAASLEGAYDGKDGAPIGACGPSGVEACTCGD